jgi:fengycin family lipopeptide synthetase D
MQVADHPDVLTLISSAVQRFGYRPAVRVDGQRITYAELDARSDLIAGALRARFGPGTGRTVGLVVARTPYLLASLIGILKSGGAYIPIDPWLPGDRILTMLTEGNAAAVLSDRSFDLADWCRGRNIPCIDVTILPDLRTASGRVDVNGDDPAYVIFTSGSTGRPKGVVVSHGNLAAFCQGWSRRIPFEGRRAMAATATIAFDIFLAETLVPLLNGVEVVLAAERDVASPEAMTRFLRRESCDMMQATPSRMRWVLSAPDPRATLSTMRVLVVGGERLPDDLATEILNQSSARLFNAYGPTEATVWTSAQEIVPGAPVTIGAPLPGVSYEITDTVAGELVIVGDLVARYLTPPEGPDPFFTTPDGRRGYRSGDLITGSVPEELRVIGRIDDQIKIDGYRVELGEIEAVARSVDGVQTAHACLVGRDGVRTLGLVVEGVANLSELAAFMATRLPRYMVPTILVRGHVPLSTAGKVSRRTVESVAGAALRAEGQRMTVPDIVDEFVGRFAGTAPVKGAGVLGRRGLGSLSCVRLLAQLEATFGCEVALGVLLTTDTIEELVQLFVRPAATDG